MLPSPEVYERRREPSAETSDPLEFTLAIRLAVFGSNGVLVQSIVPAVAAKHRTADESAETENERKACDPAASLSPKKPGSAFKVAHHRSVAAAQDRQRVQNCFFFSFLCHPPFSFTT